MTIGEALKTCRINAGLTQTQMAAGFVSESFYSKVERGVHSIDADLLFKILAAHQISIAEFANMFELQDEKSEKTNTDARKMAEAANHRDLHTLYQMQKELEQNNAPDWELHNLKCLIANVSHSNVNISEEEKNKIKKRYQNCTWSTGEFMSLTLHRYFLDFDDYYQIINQAYRGYEKSNDQSEQLECYATVAATNFLGRCYLEGVDKKYTISSLRFLKTRRFLPMNLFGAIFGEYYEALFNDDQKTMDQVYQVLKKCGYEAAVREIYHH